MPKRRFLSLLALLAGLGAAACGGEDVSVGEPAGMGAGRPDTTGAASEGVGETDPSAAEVLEGMDVQQPAGNDSAARYDGSAGTPR